MDTLLPHTEIVLTSSIEVGVGIVGFTGIVIALLGGKRTSTHSLLVTTLLFTSIATIIFSYLPLLLLNLEITGRTLWIACSGVFVAYVPVILYVRYKEVYDSVGLQKEFEGFEGYAPASLAVIGGMGLLQLANVVYLQTHWPYVFLIVFYVLFSLSIFAMLLLGIWRSQSDA